MTLNEESVSASENVINYIMNQIARRELNAGDKLDTERNLSVQFNVSRTVVREAIKGLNVLGFVDSAQGSGNYISNRYDDTVANIVKIMFLRGDVDFNNFTCFRQMLELQAFDLAIDNATNDQKKELQRVVDLLDISTDSKLIVSLDNRLHSIIAEASNNPLILINFNALSKGISEYMSNTFLTVNKKKDGYKTLQTYHHGIVDALIKGDKDKGHQAIRDHFRWVQ